MGVPKNRGTPKMDGENNGQPLFKMDDLGGTTIFGNTHMSSCLFQLGIFFPPNIESTFSLVCENGQSETSMSPICQVTCVTSFKKLHQKKRLSPIPFFPSPPLASAGGRIFVMGTWQEKTRLPFQHPWSVKSHELLGHCHCGSFSK